MEEKVIRNLFLCWLRWKRKSFTRHVEVEFKHLWLRLLNTKYVHTKPDAEGDAHIHGGIYVDVSGVIQTFSLIISWPVLAMNFNFI